MKSKKGKLMATLLKLSGYVTAFAFIASNLSQNTTCLYLYHQPKVPKCMIDKES